MNPRTHECYNNSMPVPDTTNLAEAAAWSRDPNANLLSLRRVSIEERWRELLEMAKAGHDWDLIADTLGFASGEAAQMACKRALKRWGSMAADDYRRLENEKLNEVEKAVWPLAKAGDPDSVDLWLKIHKARATLHGLGIQRQEVTHKGRANNQTLVLIGGDGKAYSQSLEEYERLLKEATVDRNVIDATVEEGPMLHGGE